jgi:hypothetical protein
MPRIKNIPGPYQCVFYSSDCKEPKHIYVRRDVMQCKFWLEPISLAWNHLFSSRELHAIRSYIEEYRARIVEAWDEHCG